MNIKLFNTNAILNFAKFLTTKHVSLKVWTKFGPKASLLRRRDDASRRDRFCLDRAKARPGWSNSVYRSIQDYKAALLMHYIFRRKEREHKRKVKHGHN